MSQEKQLEESWLSEMEFLSFVEEKSNIQQGL